MVLAVCVHVYVFVCYVCVPVHVPRGTEARGQHQVPSAVVLLQSLGQVLSLKLELRDWQHWPANPRDASVSLRSAPSPTPAST